MPFIQRGPFFELKIIKTNITVHLARHRPLIGLIEQIDTDFRCVNSEKNSVNQSHRSNLWSNLYSSIIKTIILKVNT
jgi:hypothetical protein